MSRIGRPRLATLGLLLAAAVVAPLAALPARAAAPDFTVVVLPDTQFYTVDDAATATYYQAQTRWIVQQRDLLDVAFVTHLGDMTQDGDVPADWERASAAQAVLDDAGVPNSVVRGNHDVRPGPILYDQYFPPSRYAGQPWYGGYLGDPTDAVDDAGVDTHNRDNYELVDAGGVRLLFLSVDIDPTTPEIDWAARVIDAYPDRKVVISTHKFLRADNSRTPRGQVLWDRLVYPRVDGRCRDVILVMNGHVGGESRRNDPNACGRGVDQLRFDYQGRANGGNGWLRYLTFHPATDTVDVYTYSPVLDQQENDAQSRFTLSIPLDAGPVTAPPPPGPNTPPTAAAAATCQDLTCAFSAAESSDPDGSIVRYAWDFGDGSAGSGPAPSHAYAGAGTWTATLTVTDDGGATATATAQVQTTEQPPPPPPPPPGQSAVAFRAAAMSDANALRHTVTVPGSVQPGDGLLLFATSNTVAAVTADPAGWQLVDERLDGKPDLRTRVYQRVAQPGDAGAGATVAYAARSKASLVLLAYAGTASSGPVAGFADAAETGSTATHTAPQVDVPPSGAWVVSYWADKSSTTTGWSVPDGQVGRALTVGSPSGQITALAADGGAPAPGGTWPGVSATASSPAAKATMWSIVLAPGG